MVYNGGDMNFWARDDYQKVLLYVVASVSVLLILKYLLPYFLPLLVALLIVVPLQHFCQRREKKLQAAGKHMRRAKTGQKGFMAGGILFGIILITALILVGLGTFLLSKARTIIQDADFWTNSFSQLISNVCVGIEDFFQIEGGTVEQWVSQRMEEFGGYLTKSGDGLLTGSLRYLSVAGRAGTFVLVSFICVVLFAREIEGWKQGLLNLAAIEPAIDHILSIILRIGKKLGRMIKTYLKNNGIPYKKILTTPESFYKVREEAQKLGINIYGADWFCLFDECEKITQDHDYRRSISQPISDFFKFTHKAMVSATPLSPSDPIFQQQQFKRIKIRPTFDYKKNLTLIVTNSFSIVLRDILTRLDGSPCICVFMNKTDSIQAIIEEMGLTDYKIFCSDKSVKKLHERGVHNAQSEISYPFAKYNFFYMSFLFRT